MRAAEDGRLRISGPVLMNRYRGGPDLTAAALDGEFVTSDLGYVRDGRVVVRGRADDVINTGGHKVVPGEVAAVLSSLPGGTGGRCGRACRPGVGRAGHRGGGPRRPG